MTFGVKLHYAFYLCRMTSPRTSGNWRFMTLAEKFIVSSMHRDWAV